MTEWLRCVTRNHMGFSRAGSNPAAVDIFVFSALAKRKKCTRMNSKEFEVKHVHEVYNEIAEHFSNTRYKAWPVVQRFMDSLTEWSVGVDCGCGNGKNMRINENILCIGVDNSVELLKIAHRNSNLAPVLACDIRILPFVNGSLDFAISIAVIHHLSEASDRLKSLREMSRKLKNGGQFLIFVWAAEQESIYSTPGLEKLNDLGDYLVPWRSGDKIFKRFYHLFRKGELEELVAAASEDLKVIESGYDRDNWFVIGKKN